MCLEQDGQGSKAWKSWEGLALGKIGPPCSKWHGDGLGREVGVPLTPKSSSQIRTQAATEAPRKGLLPAWPCGAEVGFSEDRLQTAQSKSSASAHSSLLASILFLKEKTSCFFFFFFLSPGFRQPLSPWTVLTRPECEQVESCDFPRVSLFGLTALRILILRAKGMRVRQRGSHCTRLQNSFVGCASVSPPEAWHGGVLQSQFGEIPETGSSSGPFQILFFRLPQSQMSSHTNSSCPFCGPNSLGHVGGWRQWWFR